MKHMHFHFISGDSMRRLLLCLMALLPACASSSGGGASTTVRPATQTIGGDAGTLTIANTVTADVSHLTFTPDAIFKILPSVFDSIGLPVNTVDPAQRTVGNTGFKIRQRLGKAPLSRYLDCGNTQIGPNADSYDVVLSVTTTASAEGASGTALSTLVDAQARPATYSQGYQHCSTKGGIEIRIAELIKARLAR